MDKIKVSTFQQRLQEVMDEKGLKQSDLAKKTGITPSSISDWLNGKYEAKQNKIDIIASKLGVSQAYLMGYDVEKTLNEKTQIPYPKTLSLEEEQILTPYNKLNTKGKRKAVTYTQDLVDTGKYTYPSKEELLDFFKDAEMAAIDGELTIHNMTYDQLLELYQEIRDAND